MIPKSNFKQCPECNSFSLRKYHLRTFNERMYICLDCNNGIWWSDDWIEYIARINHLLEEFPISQSERIFLEKIRSSTRLYSEERMRLLCIEYRMYHEFPDIENLIEEQINILRN